MNEVLKSCGQQLEQRYHYLAQGYTFDWLVGQGEKIVKEKGFKLRG